MRNFLATLFLSQGTPTLWAGDEFARTQRGNNNAYCQDNSLGWADWERARTHSQLLEFTRGLTALRRAHPVFSRAHFFEGRDFSLNCVKDITWLRPDGQEMRDQDWSTDFVRAVALLLNGNDLREVDERGKVLSDSIFLILLNASESPISFILPALPATGAWRPRLDTSTGGPTPSGSGSQEKSPGTTYRLESHSLGLLEWAPPSS
jgi:glycogen operon protein